MFRGDATRLASKSLVASALVAAAMLVGGCQKMTVQPAYTPLQQSPFFDNGMSSRPLVPGTVARGHLRDDDHFYTGKVNGEFVTTFPEPVTMETMKRGEERFNIYCSPCHGESGDGDGMIVQRGYKKPPSYHTPELRERPVGYLYDVITNGFGVMPSYAHQVPPADRWAIVAYIRALQRSEDATLADVPPSIQATQLGAGGISAPAPSEDSHE